VGDIAGQYVHRVGLSPRGDGAAVRGGPQRPGDRLEADISLVRHVEVSDGARFSLDVPGWVVRNTCGTSPEIFICAGQRVTCCGL